jgi:hypothetical protein
MKAFYSINILFCQENWRLCPTGIPVGLCKEPPNRFDKVGRIGAGGGLRKEQQMRINHNGP